MACQLARLMNPCYNFAIHVLHKIISLAVDLDRVVPSWNNDDCYLRLLPLLPRPTQTNTKIWCRKHKLHGAECNDSPVASAQGKNKGAVTFIRFCSNSVQEWKKAADFVWVQKSRMLRRSAPVL